MRGEVRFIINHREKKTLYTIKKDTVSSFFFKVLVIFRCEYLYTNRQTHKMHRQMDVRRSVNEQTGRETHRETSRQTCE